MSCITGTHYNERISRQSSPSHEEKTAKRGTLIQMVQFTLQVLHVFENLVEYCRLPRLIDLVPSCSKPEYAHVNDRYNSFGGWAYGDVQEAERLAEAGFYWTGQEDRVRCFMCNGGLCNWERQDIPLYEHSKWFNRCPYILECQKDDVVQAIVETARTINNCQEMSFHHHHSQGQTQCDSAVAKPTIHKPQEQTCQSSQKNAQRNTKTAISKYQGDKQNEFEELVEENNSLKSSMECKVCMDKKVNVIFLPCSHLVCCLECSLQVNHCPVCRKDIKATANVIL